MPRFPQRPDPFSKKSRDLDRKLRSVRAKIEELSHEVEDGEPKQSERKHSSDDPFSKPDGSENGTFQYPFESTLRPLLKRAGALLQRRSPESERLVNYLAAGSFEGMRPLRFEKRVRRNRVIFFALIIVIVIIALWSLVSSS